MEPTSPRLDLAGLLFTLRAARGVPSDLRVRFTGSPGVDAPTSVDRARVKLRPHDESWVLEVQAPAWLRPPAGELGPGVPLSKVLRVFRVSLERLEPFLGRQAPSRCSLAELNELLEDLGAPLQPDLRQAWTLLLEYLRLAEALALVALVRADAEARSWLEATRGLTSSEAALLFEAAGGAGTLEPEMQAQLLGELLRRRRSLVTAEALPESLTRLLRHPVHWGTLPEPLSRPQLPSSGRRVGRAFVAGGVPIAWARGLLVDVEPAAQSQVVDLARRLVRFLAPADWRLWLGLRSKSPSVVGAPLGGIRWVAITEGPTHVGPGSAVPEV